jgi:hypothetical protein
MVLARHGVKSDAEKIELINHAIEDYERLVSFQDAP